MSSLVDHRIWTTYFRLVSSATNSSLVIVLSHTAADFSRTFHEILLLGFRGVLFSLHEILLLDLRWRVLINISLFLFGLQNGIRINIFFKSWFEIFGQFLALAQG